MLAWKIIHNLCMYPPDKHMSSNQEGMGFPFYLHLTLSTHLRMSLLLVGHIIFRFSKVGLIRRGLFLRRGGLNMLFNFDLDLFCFESTFQAIRVCCCFLKKQHWLAKLKAKCMIKHVVCTK